LGLALSEKQTPQIVENIEKPQEQMEGLEVSFVLRRQTLFPTELRAHLYRIVAFDAICSIASCQERVRKGRYVIITAKKSVHRDLSKLG
jgi:hypothetical protein